MHFMFLILAFLLCAVVWGFFHANPRGVNASRLLACNIVILALAQRPDQKALAVYLAIMVAGSGFMIVVAVGGLVRNLVLFPLSRRAAA